MTKDELVIEIRDRLKQAEDSEGFFITITTQEGEILHHYFARHRITEEDAKNSLQKFSQELFGELKKSDKVEPIDKHRRRF